MRRGRRPGIVGKCRGSNRGGDDERRQMTMEQEVLMKHGTSPEFTVETPARQLPECLGGLAPCLGSRQSM
jgi:hypothetical protein